MIADHAVLDVRRSAGIELDSTITDTGSLDDQAAQVDFVVWSGVDRDAGAVGRHRDARLAETADDADRLVDGDRAVLAPIERIDLAPGIGLGDGERKGLTWRGAGTGVAVAAARCRHERAGILCLGRCSMQTEREHGCKNCQ